jgi:hypothetical protein
MKYSETTEFLIIAKEMDKVYYKVTYKIN